MDIEMDIDILFSIDADDKAGRLGAKQAWLNLEDGWLVYRATDRIAYGRVLSLI